MRGLAITDDFTALAPEKTSRKFMQDVFSKRHRRPAKVYRYQFNPLHYGKISSTGGYQTFLNTPLWRDVTHEYLDKTIEIEVPILDKEKKQSSRQGLFVRT